MADRSSKKYNRACLKQQICKQRIYFQDTTRYDLVCVLSMNAGYEDMELFTLLQF